MTTHFILIGQILWWQAQRVLHVYSGYVSLVLESEAAGSLIAPWWLAAEQVMNPTLSM